MTGVGLHQDLALHRQLVGLVGNGPAAGSLVEVRYRNGSTGPMRQLFHPADRLEGAVELIHGLGRRGDVYIGCAPRTHRHGGRDAIDAIWTLWADIDTPEALEALGAFSPAPALVIRSGSDDHCHAWWPLRAPLAPGEAEVANRRLAAHLGADERSTDAARILRPAGGQNWKHDPPRLVECIRLRVEGPLPLASEVLADVPELPEPDPPCALRPSTTTAGRDDDALLAIPATEFVPILLGRPLTRDGKTTCPFHAGGEERTPSLHAYDDDGGWFCFGCERGGTIIDLGVALFGIEPRGRGYHDLRRRLAADLLRSIDEAAA